MPQNSAMNICFIGKYPPIQGGVSTQSYWTARGLAQRGHIVHVITNADEVEPTFRITLRDDDRMEGGVFAPAFPEASGRVIVQSTTPPDRTQLYYVPMGNPTVSRLAGLATEAIRSHSCDIIYSYYLEPYCIAAYLASRFTGVPLVVKHAGSDLNRLMRLKDLQPTYREVLLGANRVISRGLSRKAIIGYGVPEHRVASDIGFALPTEVFRPAHNGLSRPAEGDASLPGLPTEDGRLPVLGVYGKLGEWKGSFDLLQAFARLIDSGLRARLVAVTNGWQASRFFGLITELELTEHVEVRPFIPHWRIPEFIHQCTAVAFLERDFPIAAHTPTIPSEVIACGACLIVSSEVLQKQLFRSQARHQHNLIAVHDPKDHVELCNAIRFALEDPGRARAIGWRAHRELSGADNFAQYIDSFERLFETVRTEKIVTNELRDQPVRGRRTAFDVLKDLYPDTSFLLQGSCIASRLEEAIAMNRLSSEAADRRSFALQLGEILLELISEVNPPDQTALDVCRYEMKVHEFSGVREEHELAPTPIALPAEEDLWIQLEGHSKIVAFESDVEAVICALCDGRDARNVPHVPIYVLFHKGSPPLRINDATVELLDTIRAAGGRLACSELRQRLANQLHCHQWALGQELIGVLEGLMWEGIVSFRTSNEELVDDRKPASVHG